MPHPSIPVILTGRTAVRPLTESCWRQGYARVAVHAVGSHFFEQARIRRIEAEVHPENAGSIGLLQGLDYVKEGLHRKRWVTKDEPHDSIVYGCLADDWQR